MRATQAYADLFSDLNDAKDGATLQQVCQDFAAERGVTNLIVGVIGQNEEGERDVSPLVEILPLPLHMANLKRRHKNYTATILELIESKAAFDTHSARAPTFQRDYERIWEDHLQFSQLQYFYTVPVEDEGVTRGWAGYFGDRSFDSPEAKEALQVLTHAAYERMQQLHLLPPAPSPLTRRQTDALTFCAHGKSDWEIGEILGISETTVKEHVEAAKKRLGVRTRIQAAVIAVQRGWITP